MASTNVPHLLTSLIEEKSIYLYTKNAVNTPRASRKKPKITEKTLFQWINLGRLAMKIRI